jgi:hypothetical protein
VELLEAALADAASRDARVPADHLGIRDLDDEILVLPDFSNVRSADTQGRGRNIYRSATRQVAARYHAGFSARPGDKDRGNEAPAEEFPPSFNLANRFVLDVSDPDSLTAPLLTFEGQRGGLAHPGGGNWRATLRVSMADTSPDEALLPVPAWEGFIDYLLYVRAWNYMMDSLIGLSLEMQRDAESLISFIVWFHLMLVGHIQQTRVIDGGLIPRAESEWRDATNRSTPPNRGIPQATCLVRRTWPPGRPCETRISGGGWNRI